MASIAKDVTFALGLVTFDVALYASISKDNRGTGLSNFCVGVPGAPAHDPIKTIAPIHCPECQNKDGKSFQKYRKEGKGWVHVPADVLEEAQGQVDTASKSMRFTECPAKQVDQHMVAIDAPYYLAYTGPVGSPAGEAYALIANVLEANADIALLTYYAVRSAPATYRLMARDGLLMIQKLCFPQDMQTAPSVPSTFNPKYVPMLVEAIRSNVVDFDPAQWSDKRRAAIDSYDAPAVELAEGPGGEVAPVFDLSALIAASVKAPAPVKKPAARKPRAKSA